MEYSVKNFVSRYYLFQLLKLLFLKMLIRVPCKRGYCLAFLGGPPDFSLGSLEIPYGTAFSSPDNSRCQLVGYQLFTLTLPCFQATVDLVSVVKSQASSKPNEDGTILQTRTYDLHITYDKYYQTPRLWLSGYNEVCCHLLVLCLKNKIQLLSFMCCNQFLLNF